MISLAEIERARKLTPEQILAQVDALRIVMLASFGGDQYAYERIRDADPLRRVQDEHAISINRTQSEG